MSFPVVEDHPPHRVLVLLFKVFTNNGTKNMFAVFTSQIQFEFNLSCVGELSDKDCLMLISSMLFYPFYHFRVLWGILCLSALCSTKCTKNRR